MEFVFPPSGIPSEGGTCFGFRVFRTACVREPDGSLVAMFISSYPYYYHFDALGSTRMLTDESGHITDTYTYDAWGNVTSHTGSVSQPYQYVGQLGYYTHYQDPNMGSLLQLGVRFYDRGLGRFTQRDPLPTKDSADYPYVSDMPIRMVDPSGTTGVILPFLPTIPRGGMVVPLCVYKAFKEGEYYNQFLRFFDSDKWVHCYVVCESVRCVQRNPLLACAGTIWGDLNHPPWDDWEDYKDHAKYNHAGMKIGLGLGDCYTRCWDFWKKDHDRSSR